MWLVTLSAARLRQDGKIELEVVLLIADRLADALDNAHRMQLTHGDIRPDNILISHAGVVKLVDLGVSPLQQQARQKLEQGTVPGNPLYLAPEYIDSGKATPQADIYSLGCTLFHLITGSPPYTGKRASDIIASHRDDPVPHITDYDASLPPALNSLIDGMLAKNPSWRFENLTECRDTIKKLREDMSKGEAASAPAQTPSSATRTPRPAAAPGSTPRMRPATEERRSVGTKRSSSMGSLVLFALIVIGGAAATPYLLAEWKKRRAGDIVEKESKGPTYMVVDNGGSNTSAQNNNASATTNNNNNSTSPDLSAWDTIQKEVETALQEKQWSRAEYKLGNFRREASKQGGQDGLIKVIDSQLLQLRGDASRWYTQASQNLPSTDELKVRLTVLTDMRGRVARGQRADLEARYRQTLDLLQRDLAKRQRSMIQLLEAGQFDELKTLSNSSNNSLTGTQFAQLEQQLLTQGQEAAAIAWAGDWPTTKRQLGDATGEQALACAAGLMLLGQRKEATDLLLSQNALSSGALLSRRDSLLRSQAALLSFDHPNDLSHFDIQTGQALSQDGALTSKDALMMDCHVPIGGANWEITADLTAAQAGGDGSVQMSIVTKGGTGLISLIIEPQFITLQIEGKNQQFKQEIERNSADTQIRMRSGNGNLQIIAGEETLLDGQARALPPQCRVRFEAINIDWSLKELMIIGSGQ